MDYEAVIGLETHVQLKTKSKMWCGCANEFGAPPNTHVCPVCLGLPGVLPVANEEALRLTALTGLLLNCTVAPCARFDRKNYEYLNALKDILVYGGVSDCDMEKGMVRCDVNVSVRPRGAKELGAKIEIKNMNSFSGVRRALEYEIPRQIEVVSQGGKLIQSTRRWDDVAGITEEMRTKEHAHDYRYFPEPDLMPFEPADDWLADVKKRVVELPLARKQRFMRDYQLPAPDAQTFVWDAPLGDYFENIAKQSKIPKTAANWVINNLRAKLSETHTTLANLKFRPEGIIELIGLVESKSISTSIAQQVFGEMFET